ncbi:uncharacterized protein LOC115876384 [Sitophilus oryzae]|uniref:Uncharacterized protein LOC115876384 n=1 Tax=Sitophilus oryzae TaxID=7048 RepID=A0A6J2XAZ7_SITOR|nr:uncharacterized protein LOC115876384 [Sitophilus oryzae]
MEWSNETVLEFLKYFKMEPVIWNPKHPEHKNRHVVHDAWKRLEEKMDHRFTIKELKKKKDALMATYRKIALKAMKAAMVKEELFKTDWFAHEAMSDFLSDVYVPYNKDVNYSEDSGPVNPSRWRIEEDELLCDDYDEENASIEIKAEPPSPPRSTTRPTKRSKRLQSPCTLHEEPDHSDRTTQIVKFASNPYGERAYEQFGRYIVSELRLLPERQAILLQQEMQASLTRVKLSCLDGESPDGHFRFANQ